ncbi:hypothetical protein D3C76_1286050 [compost metagenome]
MIGSETFIMVALRCTDSSTPLALASSISAAMNLRRALVLNTAQSMISPALTEVFSFRTVVLPFLSSSSMRRLSSASISAAFSLP